MVATASSAPQPYRTAFHFQPPMHWINDPNGPMIYNGIYHLFYQYNPKGAVWGNIVWAHSTSKDLINWTPQEPAVVPSQEQADIKGCWSGSTTMIDGKPVMLYTGITPDEQQVQNLIRPKDLSDPLLKEWVKFEKNPIIKATPDNKINGSAFRDPTTAWQGPDKVWRVLVGSREFKKGIAYLFRSTDFENWEFASTPLHSQEGTGMWECPDFYPVKVGGDEGVDTSTLGENIKHVLKNSLDDTKHDYYTIGSYSPHDDKYIPDPGMIDNDAGLRYDYGKFYASKTFFDCAKNRRVLWGWLNESSSVDDDVAKGWAGIQGIPRQIWLDLSGKQLMQWPIKELERLRGAETKWTRKVMEPGSKLEVTGITAGQADVELEFEIKDLKNIEVIKEKQPNPQQLCSQFNSAEKGDVGPFGLLALASEKLEEYTVVFFRVYQHKEKQRVLMCSEQYRSSLNKNNDNTTYGAFVDIDPDDGIQLRSLIDHSIIESYAGRGKGVISARVYPTLAIGDQAKLFVFNYGATKVEVSQLRAFSMEKADLDKNE